MKRAWLLLSLIVPLAGCNTLRRIPGFGRDTPAENHAQPDIYTVTGTTQGNFDLVAVRVVDSAIVVKVNRLASPEAGWHECDSFEVFLSTKGAAGGSVRFGYLNLTVGGVSFPVAPKGTPYEITSTRISGSSSHELY